MFSRKVTTAIVVSAAYLTTLAGFLIHQHGFKALWWTTGIWAWLESL